MVFLSEDGTLEYRYKVINEKVIPGKKLIARCVTTSNNCGRADHCTCSSFIEFVIPFGSNIDDLYYTEILCNLKHGVHPSLKCAKKKTSQFRNGQINLNESAEDWKQNKDQCIVDRHRMARKIYSRYRKQHGF